MSDITYIFLQMLLLLAYGCYVAYRIGYKKGSEHTYKLIVENRHENKSNL